MDQVQDVRSGGSRRHMGQSMVVYTDTPARQLRQAKRMLCCEGVSTALPAGPAEIRSTVAAPMAGLTLKVARYAALAFAPLELVAPTPRRTALPRGLRAPPARPSARTATGSTSEWAARSCRFVHSGLFQRACHRTSLRCCTSALLQRQYTTPPVDVHQRHPEAARDRQEF